MSADTKQLCKRCGAKWSDPNWRCVLDMCPACALKERQSPEYLKGVADAKERLRTLGLQIA